jgi:acyl CoA:acetate/3-ketoacid CoA transferase
MDRRTAAKKLAIAAGGLITLPFWMTACGVSDRNTHLSTFSPAQQDMLAKIVDTIIPAGSSIGALSVGADKYLQKLIDDCYEKPVQDNVKKQLQALETSADAAYGKSFAGCTQQQRQEMLLKWSHSQVKEEKDFSDLMKTETIRGFNTSQKVMEDYFGYKVAPGHYYGCVTIKA